MNKKLWGQKRFPTSGWEYVGVEDLGDCGADYIPAVCEACRREDLRFVHTLRHDHYLRPISVGCVCAAKLEKSQRAKIRERELRKLAAKRKRWLKRKWRTSSNGNEYVNVKRHNLGVRQCDGGWKFWIKLPDGSYVGKSSIYKKSDLAKLALLDAFDELLASE